MSRPRMLLAKGFTVAAGVVAALALAPSTSSAAEATPAPKPAPAPAPAVVHASPNNECKLNIRAGAGTGTPLLHTLNCDNYTTCTQAQSSAVPCAPYVIGQRYSCVGPDNRQVTDNRWAEVTWRSPDPSYVAVACAAFGTVGG